MLFVVYFTLWGIIEQGSGFSKFPRYHLDIAELWMITVKFYRLRCPMWYLLVTCGY